ncbi:MAG: hypothetical protein WBD20_07725 [Pirellulaceae bacterium]
MTTDLRTVLTFGRSRFLALGLLTLAASACMPAVCVTAADGLSSEPFSVFVNYDKAFARCGPSSEYYRTDPLRHGQKLEVYVETEDGWLGVRPPEESFCWIPASTIKTSDRGQTGVVIEDRTVAWIGTNLGRAKRYRWQVQLAEGEPVSIIGRSEREGPDGPQLWFRIVPPSGEFRWVHRDQVVNTAEELIKNASKEQNTSIASVQPERGTRPAVSVSRFGNLADVGKSVLAKAIPNKQDDQEAAPTVARVHAAPATAQDEMAVADLLSTRSANDPINPEDNEGSAGLQGSSRRTKPLVASNSANELQPLQADTAPVLSAAPRPKQSIQPQPANAQVAVGSGLNPQWQNQNTQGQNIQDPNTDLANTSQTLPAPIRQEPQVASADFVSRPRLIDIGSTVQASAPMNSDIANDSSWVIGSPRQNENAQAHYQQASGNGVMPFSAQSQKVISQASLDSIAEEARDANVEQLHLMLSRLMASSATAIETQPIAEAAARLGESTGDELVSARARLLSERVSQYQHVAVRRDGQTAVQAQASMAHTNMAHANMAYANQTPPSNPSLDLNSAGSYPNSPSNTYDGTMVVPAAATQNIAGQQMMLPPRVPAAPSASGYLVQVYSARQNSPPYALTDNVGNTIAYVTPAPGVNLRHHINSEVSILGSQGFVQGLNTPHIVASEAVRVASGSTPIQR